MTTPAHHSSHRTFDILNNHQKYNNQKCVLLHKADLQPSQSFPSSPQTTCFHRYDMKKGAKVNSRTWLGRTWTLWGHSCFGCWKHIQMCWVIDSDLQTLPHPSVRNASTVLCAVLQTYLYLFSPNPLFGEVVLRRPEKGFRSSCALCTRGGVFPSGWTSCSVQPIKECCGSITTMAGVSTFWELSLAPLHLATRLLEQISPGSHVRRRKLCLWNLGPDRGQTRFTQSWQPIQLPCRTDWSWDS